MPEGSSPETWRDHFKPVVEVRRHVEEFNPRRRWFEPRQPPIADYLVTRDASTATLAEAIRGHWGIENRLHYVLDTALGEDASRIRKNPGIFAHLRPFALNLLRHNGPSNLHAVLYDNAMDLERVLNDKGIKH